MPTTVSLSPSRYVDMLHGLQVPGYQNPYGGRVRLSRYISANSANGGALRALSLRRKLLDLTRGTTDHIFLSGTAGTEVFSGQGMRANIITAMQLVMRHREALCRIPELAEAMRQPNYLQALCDMECFGQDCIGFVGTYLVEAGVDHHFQCRSPRDFLTTTDFSPVHSVDEVHALSVIVNTSASHVQIIDRIVSRSGNHLVIDLCQSTSSTHAKGPQMNKRVTLDHRPGDVVVFARIRENLPAQGAPVETAPLWQDYLAWFAAQTGAARRRLPPAPNRAGYNSFLRSHFTEHNQARGYLGGEMFRLGHDGGPANSVGGSVYVSTKAGIALAGHP